MNGVHIMALQFKIDSETFEKLDDSIKGFYAESDDGYKLQVEGTDDAKEIKEALRKEREERAAAKARLKELEESQAAAERKRLEEKQEYQTLYQKEQETKGALEKQLNELRDKVANSERVNAAESIVAGLIDRNAAGGVQRYELLRKEALAHIAHTPEGVKINGKDGEAWDAQKLGSYLSEQYPFLVDGSKATGGGAIGGNGGGAPTTGNFGGSREERKAAIAAKFKLEE